MTLGAGTSASVADAASSDSTRRVKGTSMTFNTNDPMATGTALAFAPYR